jgi:hypothetical protein
MPKTRTVPGVGQVDFPDGMSDEEIKHATADLQKNAPAAPKQGDHPILDALDYVGAVAGVVGGMLPDPRAYDPAAQAAAGVSTVAKYVGRHVGKTGVAQAALSAVPIIGEPAAALIDPSISYAEGYAPTHEQNVAAVEGGAGLAALVLAPEVIKKAQGKALARIRGAELKPTPVTAPEFTPEEIALADQAGKAQAAAQPRVSDLDAMRAQMVDAQKRIAANSLSAFPDEPTEPPQTQPEPAGATTAPDGGDAGPAEPQAAQPEPVAPAPSVPPSTPGEALPPVTDSEFGAALRTLHTGERDVRIADANNLALDIRDALPDHVDREALTLMRDFRNNPAQLEAFAAGMDPAYDGMPGDVKAGALDRMAKLRPAMERALNPTDAMKAADAALTDYFGKTLQEGRDLGFLDSGIRPEEYINHLLLPADAEPSAGPKTGPSGVNRYTPFAKARFYPTVLDAVAAGADIRTLDVADALSIYGDKHGTAAATHILIDTLKAGDIGKFKTASTAPKGWGEVGPGTRLFRNEVAFTDADGNAQVAHQALYAPQEIADALRPLTDPDYSSTIPGFTKTKLYQQYVKSVELGLSVFHIRAMNLSALGNEGLTGLIKSYAADMTSPEFRDVERTMLRHGGTTSITGRTFEAYRAARQTSLPTRLDVIRNLPVFRQFDQMAAATSHLTFDVMQRKFKVTDFGIKDAKWIADHMKMGDHLTPEWPAQLAKARRSIAKEVNAVYGGLNWEALGVNKLTRSMSKALFLAPDWTFSNWQNAKTAFTGGPGGAAARAFWVRSAMVGVGLTQLTSLMLGGKKSDDPTQVYLGQDHHGNDVYQNIFFAGAPSDMVGLIKNVQDYGAVEGTAHSIAAKLAPITRTGVQLITNRNWMGQEIAKRGSGVQGDVRTAMHLATNLTPIPFSLTNVAQMAASNVASGRWDAPNTIKTVAAMIGDPTKDYTPTEFLTTVLGGTKPRHIPHWKRVREQQKRSQ